MVNKLVVPKIEEVRVQAIKAIIEQLGIAKAAFFCRVNMSQNVDYLELKEQMFGNKTAMQIYEEIKRKG